MTTKVRQCSALRSNRRRSVHRGAVVWMACCYFCMALTIFPFGCDGSIATATSTTTAASAATTTVAPPPFRAEAAVMASSSIVDQETGRIFWEGGSRSTLIHSLAPKLQAILRIPHLKATALSSVLWYSVAGRLAGLLGQQWLGLDGDLRLSCDGSNYHEDCPAYIPTLLVSWARTILDWPSLPRWLVGLAIVLYLLEAYCCSTLQYLTNVVEDGGEACIDTLRRAVPTVEWKVRSFHYETPSFLSLSQWLWRSSALGNTGEHDTHSTTSSSSWWWWQRRHQDSANNNSTNGKTPGDDSLPTPSSSCTSSWYRRKVVTHTAVGSYILPSCHDRTTAGVWKRGRDSTSGGRGRATHAAMADGTKMIVSTTVLLKDAKAREDYLSQQQAFLQDALHRDECAEFSTKITVPGWQPRWLVVRNHNRLHGSGGGNLGMTRFFWKPSVFWLCTVLGLTVPYRHWFTQRCDQVRVTVVKEAGVVEATKGSWLFKSSSSSSPSSSVPTHAANEPLPPFQLFTEHSVMESDSSKAEEQRDVTALQIKESLEAATLLAQEDQQEALMTSSEMDASTQETQSSDEEQSSHASNEDAPTKQ